MDSISVAFFADFLAACESSEEGGRDCVRTSPRQMMKALSLLSELHSAPT